MVRDDGQRNLMKFNKTSLKRYHSPYHFITKANKVPIELTVKLVFCSFMQTTFRYNNHLILILWEKSAKYQNKEARLLLVILFCRWITKLHFKDKTIFVFTEDMYHE